LIPLETVEIANRGNLYSVLSINEWDKTIFWFNNFERISDLLCLEKIPGADEMVLYHIFPSSFMQHFREIQVLCKIKPILGEEDSFWNMCKKEGFPNGLPLDFERSYCFDIAPEKTTRSAALEYCASRGGHLASPEIMYTPTLLQSAVRKIGNFEKLQTWTNVSTRRFNNTRNNQMFELYFGVAIQPSQEICIGLNILSGQKNEYTETPCDDENDLRYPLCIYDRIEEAENDENEVESTCPENWKKRKHEFSDGENFRNFTCKSSFVCSVELCELDLFPFFGNNEELIASQFKNRQQQELLSQFCASFGAFGIIKNGLTSVTKIACSFRLRFEGATSSNLNATELFQKMFKTVPCERDNSEDFVQFSNSSTCFYLSKDAKSWSEAHSFCKTKSQSVLAYLPLLNDALQARQILINSNASDQVWIGLTSYHDLHTFGDWSNEFKWAATGQSPDLNEVNFLSGSPLRPNGADERCISLINDENSWQKHHCADRKRFICTLSDIKPRTDPFANRNKAGWCPADTYKQGQSCFNFFEENSAQNFNLTYDEAKELCEKQEGRQLASFSRFDQNLALAASLCNSSFPPQIRGFWLGLVKHGANVDEFKWSDQSALTFTNWVEGETTRERFSRSTDQCVYFNADSGRGEIGQWKIQDCNDMKGMGALCSHPKWATKEFVEQCRDTAPINECNQGTTTPLGCRSLNRQKRNQCAKTCGFCGKRRVLNRMQKPNGDFYDNCPDVEVNGTKMKRKAAGKGCFSFNRWSYSKFNRRERRQNREDKISDATWDDAQAICMAAKEDGENGKRANLVHGDSCAYTTMEAYLWKEAFLAKGIRPENNDKSENESADNNDDLEDNEETGVEDDSMSEENVDEDVFTRNDKLAWVGLRFNFESSSFEQVSGRLGGGNHWAIGEPNLTRRADEKYLCAAADYSTANKTEWRMVSCNMTLPVNNCFKKSCF
jgi:hypothetical protein